MLPTLFDPTAGACICSDLALLTFVAVAEAFDLGIYGEFLRSSMERGDSKSRTLSCLGLADMPELPNVWLGVLEVVEEVCKWLVLFVLFM